MSRRIAGVVLALVFAGSSGLFALRPAAQQTDTVESLSSGLKHLEKGRLNDAKRTYMYLFVHDRTASSELMKAMKAWVKKERGHHGGVDAATFEAFDAWVRERDALAAAVVNLGHNSPDWK